MEPKELSLCKMIKLLYNYGTSKNYTMKEIYEGVWAFLKNDTRIIHWNAHNLFLNFIEDKLELNLKEAIKEDVDQNNISLTKNEWHYLIASGKRFSLLFDHSSTRNLLFNWSTSQIGTFFLKALPLIYKKSLNNSYISWSFKDLHQLFTIQGQSMSLIEIAYLYSMMDLENLDDDLYTPFLKNNETSKIYKRSPKRGKPPPPPSFEKSPFPDPSLKEKYKPESSFLKCFKMISIDSVGGTSVRRSPFAKSSHDSELYVPQLPCTDLKHYPECNEYCNWHSNYFTNWPREEFLTIMRYAMPQRKLSLEPVPYVEQKLAEDLFGPDMITKLKNPILMTPIAMAIFCHQSDKGFVGDDIGISKKVCNDFFPTPTDIGICQTKGLDIKKLMHFNQHYEVLFESDKRTPSMKFKGGALWNEVTFAILTDTSEIFGQSNPMKQKVDLSKIQFQIHQNNEIAPIMMNHYIPNLKPLDLEAGKEYFIQVHPTGISTTEDYKSISLRNRKCKLSEEVEQSSVFKIYTNNNCKYECHIRLIGNLCKCIPWEFIHNTSALGPNHLLL